MVVIAAEDKAVCIRLSPLYNIYGFIILYDIADHTGNGNGKAVQSQLARSGKLTARKQRPRAVKNQQGVPLFGHAEDPSVRQCGDRVSRNFEPDLLRHAAAQIKEMRRLIVEAVPKKSAAELFFSEETPTGTRQPPNLFQQIIQQTNSSVVSS